MPLVFQHRTGDESFCTKLTGLGQRGLTIPDATVEVGEKKLVTLVVSNQCSEPDHLDEGEPLGALHPVRMLAESDPDGIVSATQAEDREERKNKLFKVVAVESIKIPPTQLDQLQELVSEFTDMFAL